MSISFRRISLFRLPWVLLPLFLTGCPIHPDKDFPGAASVDARLCMDAAFLVAESAWCGAGADFVYG